MDLVIAVNIKKEIFNVDLLVGGIKMNDAFSLLQSRGFVYQCTNLEGLEKLLKSDKKVTFYLGIEPTADSIHIGHFFALMMFRHLQNAGHRGILLIGGATAMVGDPSGKSDMRTMMTKAQVEHNLEEVKTIAKKFIITEGDNPAIIVNNADWTNQHSYIDFMRMVGVHFNVNVMLAAEAYASRLNEGGLTFLEMGYMLMQAYDFVYLKDEYDCVLQIGGSDQWGNIVAGSHLYRKMQLANQVTKTNDEIFGLTSPLLRTKEGKKMGKTESGTLWVDPERTSSYEFYQYFYNVDDKDVEMLLQLFTLIPLEEIAQLCQNDIIQAKRVMAYEITKLIHGKEGANKAIETAKALFSGEAQGDNAPESEYVVETDSINVVDLFFNSGMASSKGEVRRLIQQNGASVDGVRCTSIDDVISKPDDKNFVLLKKGKKSYLKVRFV